MLKKVVLTVFLLGCVGVSSLRADYRDGRGSRNYQSEPCEPCEDPCYDPCEDPCCWNFQVEFRAAYYLYTSSTTKEIYGDGNGLYGGEIAFGGWCDFYLFANAAYLRDSGRSIGEGDKTHLMLVPVGVGLKYMPNFCGCWRPYIGVGYAATYIETKDFSPFVKKKRNNWAHGVVGKLGTQLEVCNCLFFDLFIDYTWAEKKFSDVSSLNLVGRRADVSGFAFGLGLGYTF